MPLVSVTSSPVDFGDSQKGILLFTASWHHGCAPIEAVLSALLASSTDQVFVGTVDAEAVPALTDNYNVTAVPTVLFCQGKTVLERLEGGVEPAQVTVAFQRLLAATTVENASIETPITMPVVDPEQALKERLDALIRSDSVMLFLKGTPSAPRCGFSRQAVELLNEHKVPFGSFDILSDEDVRQGLKKHSNWPTYPQIYVNGELQGGLDILKEMAEEGSLLEQWNLQSSSNSPATSLQDRLRQLVNRSDVMVFMKGLPSAPKCGFSRQLIELLDGAGVPYDAFDILQDDDVRQGLKTFSNWPTYPQLYVKGDLVGGLDICKELQESGELMDVLRP